MWSPCIFQYKGPIVPLEFCLDFNSDIYIFMYFRTVLPLEKSETFEVDEWIEDNDEELVDEDDSDDNNDDEKKVVEPLRAIQSKEV